MANKIYYKAGYKYQLDADYKIKTLIKPTSDIEERFIKLNTKGYLTILTGYAWDGPSGPVPDTKYNMRASLIHDALYQLLRAGYWDKSEAKGVREKADKLFRKICIKDGVFEPIAHAYYAGLRIGAEFAADPKNRKKRLKAPD